MTASRDGIRTGPGSSSPPKMVPETASRLLRGPQRPSKDPGDAPGGSKRPLAHDTGTAAGWADGHWICRPLLNYHGGALRFGSSKKGPSASWPDPLAKKDMHAKSASETPKMP